MSRFQRRGPLRPLLILVAIAGLLGGLMAVPAAAAAPDDPIGVSVAIAANGDGVTVSWTAGAENGDPITGFDVALNGPNPDSAQVGAGATSVTFTGMGAGSYDASVTATSGGGDSAAVDSAGSVTVAAPDAPPSVAVAASGADGVTVSWVAGNDNGSPTTQFGIHLVATNGGSGKPDESTNSGTTTVDFTNLDPGTYSAQVWAVADVGNSPTTASAGTVVISTPATAPGPPRGVTASFSGGRVVVTFGPPVDNGGAAVTSYRVRLLKGTTLIATENPANDTGFGFPVTDSGDYTVEVRACNSAGLSSPVVAPPNGGVVEVRISPSAPRNVTASSVSDQVTIHWLEPVTDGGAIDHYTVSFDGQTYQVDHPDTELLIGGVSPGTYTATVVAVNTATLSSPPAVSDPETVTLPPGAPSNVAATASVRTVTITWDEPASSGGLPVSEYVITLDGTTKTTANDVFTVVFGDVSLGEHHAEVFARTALGLGARATSNVFEVRRAFHPFENSGNFVEQLYGDILGRRADAGGRAYWVDQLGATDAKVPFVVNQFLSSAEFGPRRPIIRLYLAYFNRAPDAGGFDYWTGLFASNRISLVDASYTFANSKEFKQTYGELNDGQFIVLVYNNVLGRRPDVPGFNFWINKLNHGLNRAELMLAFSESPEFQGSSANFVDITMVYRGMMNRIPDANDPNNEYTVWLPRLAGSENVDDLIMTVFGSDEYESRIRP